MPRSHKLVEHLRKEHRASPLQTYLKEIVYGGNDGIVTTFAIVAGFAGANMAVASPLGFMTVLLFGFANLLADGMSMGLGNFLSLRAEHDVYKSEEAKERHEIRTNPQMEKEETVDILLEKGFSKEQAQTLTEIYATNEKYWISFMMNYELEMPNPENENPLLTGLVTFFSFLVFGAIPLLPYIFNPQPETAFQTSLTATAVALVLLGLLRWKVTRIRLFRSVSEIVLLGGVAALIAYLVGTFFKI